jgi:transposase
MNRQPYSTDLSDGEWAVLAALIPAAKPGGRPRKYPMREVVNAVFYLLRTGCSWRLLPHDLPPYRVVFHYFSQWRKDGTWEAIHRHLQREVRLQAGHDPEASAAIIDSQSVKTTEKGA